MKDPAFLFYPNDYLGGTMGMTFEEKGAYIELLMLQFNRGHMTSHMIAQTIGQLWDTLKDKFIQDDKGLFYNIRLEDEQNKRKLFTDSRRNNKLGINQHTKKEGHMTSHMEDENEDVNIVINTKEIKDKFEIFRKQYPSTKGGPDVEFKNFQKKCKIEDIELFIPALNKEKIHKKKLKELKMFCPEWKNLSTWINQKCWLQELPNLESDNTKVERVPMTVVERGMNAEEYLTYGLKPEYRS